LIFEKQVYNPHIRNHPMTYQKLKREADELKKQANELLMQAAVKMDEANALRNKCNHQWGKINYDPIVEPSRWIEGDPPGTMGVDHRSGFFTGSKNTPRWERTCACCGWTQATVVTKMQTGANGLKHEVPDFDRNYGP
jgi:hypothetical protein